jgi:hypothetical protein
MQSDREAMRALLRRCFGVADSDIKETHLSYVALAKDAWKVKKVRSLDCLTLTRLLLVSSVFFSCLFSSLTSLLLFLGRSSALCGSVHSSSAACTV